MHDFTVVVLEDAYPSGVAVTVDMLVAAAALARRSGTAAPRWRICSLAGGPLRLQNGLTVQTDRLPVRTRDDHSTWVLPGLGLPTPAEISRRLQHADTMAVIARIARHAKRGGAVAASCSSVFLLHAAGLLSQRRATTSWWLAPLLQQLAPDCRVDAHRMVCADGAITTAGAAFAQTDLMLHLLRERCGSKLAEAVTRMLLIDGRQAQAPYIVPEVMASGSDLVARLTTRIEAALPQPPSVTELAREFCVTERTLARHVQRATGKGTLALIQSVRLRRARMLLETSRLTVEQIAAGVGYQDATALRRLMRKVAGANPSRYRSAIAP